MGRATLVAVVAALFTALAAPSALAGPLEDYRAIRADWSGDGRIEPCRWTRTQLESARSVSNGVSEDVYTSFPGDIDTEIARWRSGHCAGRTPEDVRARSPLATVQITRVSGRRGARRESVRVRNRGRTAVSLSGATLRNVGGRRVRLPRGFVLRPGRSATIRLACLRGQRRATVRGGRVYLCSRHALFSDRGDVARLADRRGIVVSQRGFGRYRRIVPF